MNVNIYLKTSTEVVETSFSNILEVCKPVLILQHESWQTSFLPVLKQVLDLPCF